MMLTRDEVLRVAALARLALDDSEVTRLQRELGAVLQHVQTLATLDLAGVEPLTHTSAASQPLRDDTVVVPPGAVALQGAPALQGNLLVVPKVLE